MATNKGQRKGILFAIGGHEEKSGEMSILRRIAECVKGKRLVVATLASSEADEMWSDYKQAFHRAGVREVVHLNLGARPTSIDEKTSGLLKGAGGVFFTGGDQLQITSKLGGTELCEQIHDVYRNGGVIAGTSAGASVLTETMIVSGGEESSHRLDNLVQVAPGLGFLAAMVIDQHFAERGRVARLLGVVAHNPRAIGIGIDENTAIEIHGEEEFEVIGKGAVYVLDGRPMTYTNVSETEREKTLSAFGVTLHLLSATDRFALKERVPLAPVAA